MSARPSIRRRVLVLAMIAVALVWTGTAAVVYFDARHEIDEGFDGHLAQTAALLVALSGGDLHDIDEEHAPRLDKRARRVAFQIWRGNRLLLHSVDAPDEPLAQREGYSDRTIDKRRWRVFSTRTRDGRIIHVGERSDTRDELARGMVINMLSPMLYALPVLALMLWLAVARGMRSLAAITGEVSARDPDNLSPLGVHAAPAEVVPLLEQLNRLFGRIEQSLESERQFTADAAHELRTPVAAIKAQAQVALAATVEKEREDGLRKVVAGCDRAAHLVDQLLVLARLDTANHVGREPCSLRALAAQAVAEAAPYAVGKNVSLELDAGDEGRIAGTPALLHVLLRNLIDNAARYSPSGTAVHIGIAERDDVVELRVVDQGPGIPEAERQRVFQRFYRALGTGEEGTGLGLSIVQRIAEIHGARIELGTGPDGKGLAVSIVFPHRDSAFGDRKSGGDQSVRLS